MAKQKIKSERSLVDLVVENALFLSAFFSILVTVGIIAILLTQSVPFFNKVGWGEFLFGTKWAPLFKPEAYGVLPLVFGTMLIVVIAAAVALPFGIGSAIYMSEYASPRVRNFLKPVLEVLAGIPTVVYGYFALTFITPMLRMIFPNMELFNALSGGIVVGIMILPMVASLSEDALRAVPNSLRQGGYALGAQSYQVILGIVLPSAASGLSSSVVLALSRAIGETMAVTIAAGSTPKLTLDPTVSIQTMTAYIVQISKGDTPAGTTSYYTLYAVAMVLFVITFAMNVMANRIRKHFREVYE
ncbi:MAG: phosphate ABC transporter permease subunit PstC [Candidatus Sumerlaeia bacterium]|nr:phosphate ABC transporter permease subunit PstC [Candidatus Sumerlaeia bacterium]